MKQLFFSLAVAVTVLLTACNDGTTSDSASDKTTEANSAVAHGDLVPLTRQIIYDVLVRTPSQEEETDWRLTNLPEAELDRWLGAIYQDIADGKLKAYSHPLGVPTKDAKYEVAPADFEEILHDTVYFWVEDPDTHEMTEVQELRPYPYDAVTSIEFTEEWSYNAKTLRLEKKVSGMTLMFAVYSMSSGEFMGNKKKIQVWFDDRPMLDYPA